MSYQDFLSSFAAAQGLESVDTLLNDHPKRYSFQINSRERAKDAISTLEDKLNIDWNGLKILDIGCAYGAFTIELANRGAKPIGIDINNKWLALAEQNALNEVDVPFINCDASSIRARRELEEFGPFDLVLVNDVFEHIYDTAGLLSNLRSLMNGGASLYFKVPNGQATRHVISEGHKKVFGISLLAPDYWTKFVKAPFHIYYRRWSYFLALFKEYGFENLRTLNVIHDTDIEQTRRHISNDLRKIKTHLTLENFESPDQFRTARHACQYYFDEVEYDMDRLNWEDLFFKYRVTFWEGIIDAAN